MIKDANFVVDDFKIMFMRAEAYRRSWVHTRERVHEQPNPIHRYQVMHDKDYFNRFHFWNLKTVQNE